MSGGYNFTIPLRQSVPAVLKAGLALMNFQTGLDSLISYRTQILSFGTTSGLVNIELVGFDSKMVYLAFSVIIITEANSYV